MKLQGINKTVHIIRDSEESLFRCFALASGLNEDMYDMIRHVLEEECINHQDTYSQYTAEEKYIRAFCHVSSFNITVHKLGSPPEEFKSGQTETTQVDLILIGAKHYDIALAPDLKTEGDPECKAELIHEEALDTEEAKDTESHLETKREKHCATTTSSEAELPSHEEIERKVLESESIIKHQQIIDDTTTLTRLLQTVLLDRKSTMDWLISKGMINMDRQCTECQSQLRFRRTLSDREDGEFWCPSCHRRFSIRSDTLISSLRLSPQKFTQVLILWLKGAEHSEIAREDNTQKSS